MLAATPADAASPPPACPTPTGRNGRGRSPYRVIGSIACAILLVAAPGAAAEPPEPTMQISSPAFPHQGRIPRIHTCEGNDSAPLLAWEGVPPGTASLALIVDDPDAPDPKAPKMTWVHQVLYDLPPDSAGLPGGAKGDLPPGTRQGKNDWKRTGWGGPCPPIGRHRYFFKLYALDAKLGDLGEPTKPQLEAAMKGHVLAKAELIGTYQKGD